MHPAALPSDATTIVAVLFLLFGVPAILFALLLLYTGYVRYDAEQYLEELEDADLEDGDLEELDERVVDPTDPEDREGAGYTDTGTDSLEGASSVFDDTGDEGGGATDSDEYSTFEDDEDASAVDPDEYSVFDDDDDGEYGVDEAADSGEYSVFDDDDEE